MKETFPAPIFGLSQQPLQSSQAGYDVQQKIRSTAIAALLALTALSETPLTANAGTTHGAGLTVGEIRHVVAKYLTEHLELLRQAAPAPQGIYVGDS